ncbi:MAG TPA: Hsp20/alpha crystallin family protein [Chthonomonadaceae bacterium]|nr:Hsp20/alpha crystallin family protein [Chthonomonadaceae bacterium]
MLRRNNQGGGLMRRPQGTLARPYGFGAMGGWDPWSEMEEMQRRMDDLFSNFFGTPAFSMPSGFGMAGLEAEPDVDVMENDKEYTIRAALPGIEPQDIHVEATENSITLWAESRAPFEGQDQQSNMQDQGQQVNVQGATQSTPGQTTAGQTGTSQLSNQTQSSTGQSSQQPHTVHRQGRYSRVTRFQFAYTFPNEFDPNNVQANFKNGMLELHLPKRQPTTNRVPISIQAGGQQGTQPSLQSQSGSQQQGTGATSGFSSGESPGEAWAADQQHQPRAETSNTAASAPATENQPATGSKTSGP